MARRLFGLGSSPIRPSYDPGMARKMGPAGLADLPELVAGRAIDVEPLLERVRFVDSRIDCADFRALTLARVVHADMSGDGGEERWRLPADVAERVAGALTGFRYSHDVPGDDSMCLWSENHQVVVAVAEHAAGLAYPGRRFSASGATGAEHAAGAAARLRTWLADRFRMGFIEWLSPTYYEEDAAALAVLVDVTDDDDLRERARGVLDLLAIDLALHSADGLLVGSAGRAYAAEKKAPWTQQVAPVIAHLLGGSRAVESGEAHDDAAVDGGPDDVAGGAAHDGGAGGSAAGAREPAAERLGGLLRASTYRAPDVARSIAADDGPLLVREGFGLDLDEVAGYVGDPDALERRGLLLWAMESFTDPESVRTTMDLVERWDMWDNRFLAPLKGFRAIPRRALPALVRAVDPATRGVSITRADVVTWRRGGLALSSVQHHNVGGYGDQQHLWQATLPGGAPIFATHPGRALFDDVARNFSPSAWTGNGRNPDVAQDGQVMLALHRLGGRRGYLERDRHRWTHLHWPTALFESHEVGADWAVARAGDGLVGVRSLEPLRAGAGDELVQSGDVTGWAVVVAGAEVGYERFRSAVAGATLERDRTGRAMTLRLEARGGDVRAGAGTGWGGDPAEVRGGDRLDVRAESGDDVTRDDGREVGRSDGRHEGHDGRLPTGEWTLRWGGGLLRDGLARPSDRPRLAFGDTRVERFPERIVVRHGGHELVLTPRGRESATSGPASAGAATEPSAGATDGAAVTAADPTARPADGPSAPGTTG